MAADFCNDATRDLLDALWGHDIPEAMAALAAGANINGYDEGGYTAVTAAVSGEPALLDFVIGAGVDVNLCNQDGMSPVTTALLKGDLRILELLLQRGARIDVDKGPARNPPLHWICERGTKEQMAVILRCRPLGIEQTINAGNYLRLTPLYIAVDRMDREMVSLVLELGPDVNRGAEWDGRTALHRAAELGASDLIRQLLDAGARPDVRDFNGMRPVDLMDSAALNALDPNCRERLGKSG